MMPETDTLAELYARDPLTLTSQDITRIIEAQREARRNYVAGGKVAKAADKTLDLEDLGLL